jgi:hypothetical protein
MEEMVRMNNNHQAQHVRHTQHTHTLRRGGGVQRMLAGRIYYFTVSRARPLDSIEKEKKEKKIRKKQRCHYRSFKCFYVSASPDKHFNLLLVQLFPL